MKVLHLAWICLGIDQSALSQYVYAYEYKYALQDIEY